MATTFVDYTGDGNATKAFSFPSYKEADIKVEVDNVIKSSGTHYNITSYTTTGGGNVVFTSGNIPSSPAAIRIFRDTDVDTAKATFTAGSAVKAGDLNNNMTQILYAAQEEQNQTILTSDIKDAAVTTAKIKDANVTTAKIAADNITAALIADDQINSEHYVDGSIDTAHIADSQITTAKIADSNVTTAKIADSNVTTAKIAADAINGTKIANDSINSEHYVDGSIDTAHIADGQVTHVKLANDAVDGDNISDDSINSEHYVDGSIDTAHIADSQVTTAKIADSNVTTAKIASDAITGAKIADDAVDSEHLAADSIDAEHYAAGSVDTTALGADAVTGAKIADNAIDSEHYTDGSIDTAHIGNSQVTTAKIAADNITNALIADDQIDSEHYVDGSIDTAHIGGAQVTDAKLASNSVITSKITDANVTTVKIADSNVTLAKLASDLKQTSISDSDTQLPTSGAVVDYVAAQIAPLGGLEVVATEVAFPNTQPASGVVISISDAGGVVVNGSGVSTTGRTVGGSTVTINNFPSSLQSKTMAAGVGLMVSSTGSSQTYNYHKLLAKEADVEQLSNDINDFAARYRVGSSNPTSDNDAGDLFFNTGSNKLLVYNASNTAWEETQTVGNFFINTISSSSGTGGGSATFNGSAYRFTLSNAGTYAQQHIVSINGVVQKPNTGTSQPSEGFAIDGGDIIFSSAPASGADYFIITVGASVSIGTPSDGTVSTAKLANGAVTTVKLADANVTTAKIADDAVTAAKLASDAVVTASIVDANVTTAKIADDAVTADKLANSINSEIAANTAKTTNATHSGEVTGATALTIADNVVDEANLKVSNSPTNGYFLSAQSGNTGGLTWAQVTTDLVGDTSPQLGGHLSANTYNIEMGDSSGTSSGRLNIGASQDLVLYHNGSNSIIDSNTGNLEITTDSFFVNNAANNEVQIKAVADGAVELYHNGTKKLETTSGGAEVFGELQMDDANSHIKLPDSARIDFGTGNDLRIYHDGSTNIIEGLDGIMSIRPKTGENGILLRNNGAVELYYDDAKKFETRDDGCKITGSATEGKLIIESAGDAHLYLHADTDNSDESHNPTIHFQQDGSSTYLKVGVEGNSGTTFTSSTGNCPYVCTTQNLALQLGSDSTIRWEITGSGHLVPIANNTYDIGTSSVRVRNIYTNDLHLSNEGSSNDVDSTWGDWTIQEGESDLFLKNNRSGKKYKFNLTEVS